MTLAVDTDPWLVALPAAIAALAAIGGGYLAGCHQLKAQREDQREARVHAARDRQIADLRELQEVTGAVSSAYSKARANMMRGAAVPDEVVLDELLAGVRVYGLVARIGDAALAEKVEEWMDGQIRFATERDLRGEPVGALARDVHDRVGELLREAESSD